MCEQAQPELKQTEITPIPAVDHWQPPITLGAYAQVDDPEIGQTGGNQEPRQPLRIAYVALVQLKAPTFLVRKEGFNVKPVAIPGAGFVHQLQVADQVERVHVRG